MKNTCPLVKLEREADWLDIFGQVGTFGDIQNVEDRMDKERYEEQENVIRHILASLRLVEQGDE